MDEVVERFLRYIQQTTLTKNNIPSQGKESSVWTYTQQLYHEMIELGMSDVTMDENGYLMGFIPSNMKREIATVGFIAYIDSLSDPIDSASLLLMENYSGNDIAISKDTILISDEFPQLKEHIGDTILTSNGTTLLNAKYKAGVAEILSAMQKILSDPTLPHGRIGVCFIPLENIEKGIEQFDFKRFGAKFAYSLQAGATGELQVENFNQAIAKVVFKGSQMIVKELKGKSVNAINVAKEFIDEIPEKEMLEKSVGYEGYYNLRSIQGNTMHTEVEIEICDFDKERFEWRKSRIQNGVYEYTKKYDLPIEYSTVDKYYNMKDKIEPVSYISEIAKRAIEGVGLKVKRKSLRDVTESAKFAYLGLPTVDLFTGVHNSSSKYEFIPMQSLSKARDVIVKIVELCAQI